MSLFTPNTGDQKMDEAYMRMQEHVSKCKSFDEFSMHFSYIVKTDDPERLNRWLLKVLYVSMKQDPKEMHDFDILLGLVDKEKAEELNKWLSDNLKIKYGMG